MEGLFAVDLEIYLLLPQMYLNIGKIL